MWTAVRSMLGMAVLAVAGSGMVFGQPAATGQYGPCCPLVQGQKALAVTTRAGGMTVTGPRQTCQSRRVTVVLGGTPQTVEALSVAGTLLVPARLFQLMDADMTWEGNRQLTIARGDREVAMRVGSFAVTTHGSDAPQTVSWPLCPRLIQGMVYVPVRSLAEALELNVAYRDGQVHVTEPVTLTSMSTASAIGCPADTVEMALGVMTVRSLSPSHFGAGVGILEVNPNGVAASFGVRPGDVILGANGRRTVCPKDIGLYLMSNGLADASGINTLTVSRGERKVILRRTDESR